MQLSYTSPEGVSARAGHRWLIASLCLSLALHGLLAFIHPGSPIVSVQTGPTSPPATRLKVELLPARQARSIQFTTSSQTLPEMRAPPEVLSRPAGVKRDRHVPSNEQAPSRAEVSEAYSAAGSDSASPSIDLDAARASARQTARAQAPSTKRTAPDPTDAAEPETVLGRKISRSANPDCRTSYAGAGLLAIPLLLKDAVSDGGCKW